MNLTVHYFVRYDLRPAILLILNGFMLAPQVGLEPTTLRLTAEWSWRAARNHESRLIRVTIENVAPSVLAFGMGGEQLLIPLDWNTPIAIDVAAVEPQVEMLPVVILSATANILDFTGTQFMPCTRIPILSTSSRSPPALPIGLVAQPIGDRFGDAVQRRKRLTRLQASLHTGFILLQYQPLSQSEPSQEGTALRWASSPITCFTQLRLAIPKSARRP